MHIVVIGAGIIGTSTAYALMQDGHYVTLIDAAPHAGTQASRANGGQLSYSFVAPLAEPAVLPQLPRWLLREDSPLRWRPRADPAQWRWILSFLLACRRGLHQETTRDLLALGMASRHALRQLVERESPAFDFTASGKLQVYGDTKSLDAARRRTEFLASLGCPQQILSAAECVAREPALADMAGSIAGGVHTETEDAGDAHALCRYMEEGLRQSSRSQLMFDTTVQGWRTSGLQVVALRTSRGELAADGYVLAGGVGSQALAQRLGMDLGIYPLKGYSLTYALTPDSRAPAMSVSDIASKVVYARLGDRLRVAGMVDIGHVTTEIDAGRITRMEQAVAQRFPRLNAAGAPSAWAGLRPARPNGKPLIGSTRYDNLWLNTGHGMLGFTLAAGSARLLADQIAGRPNTLASDLFQP
ncbi:D-amino acid dehydrogenase small subunit [plant metagenome]|uniref:D-amino acid dehydrogenase small subunit n=1 Tax=plant metagenome TaxID=1297885 RepID=A0A484XZ34_9ZZZZ